MKATRSAALVAFALLWALGPARVTNAQDAAAAPAWKPFQEFGFLTGGWSGTAENGTRIGGRVSRYSLEMGGNYLVHRGTTVFPAQGGQQEESTEEVGYFTYDRERRKYVAQYFFSTGVVGFFDVDFPSDGTLRLVSTSLVNFEPGGRTRLTISRKTDAEIAYQLEVAPSGKEFVAFVTSKMTRK